MNWIHSFVLFSVSVFASDAFVTSTASTIPSLSEFCGSYFEQAAVSSASFSRFCKDCGQQVHTNIQGFIVSPGFPNGYPNETNCVWRIKGNRGSIISINFVSFNIEDEVSPLCNRSVSSQPCCASTWLKLGVPETEDPLVLCSSNTTPKPYLSSGPEVYVKFHSSSSPRGRGGFKLSYLIIPFEIPVPCQPNETTCLSNLYECHPKCDHVMQCSNGADEMDCVKGCKGRVMCSSWNGCYLPDERCNGVAQCGDHSDERNCSPDLCRSERGGFLCSNLQCIRESWQCDQTNDCGDNSDEVNCLKNSVITAAVMGSLICGLLLVIAIGCTCKLYALRYNESHGPGPRATLPMSPLEQEMLHREPPPPYSIAISQPPATYFSTQPSHAALDPFYYARMCRGLHHHRRGRRTRHQRRQPPPPPVAALPPSSSSSSCLLVVPPDVSCSPIGFGLAPTAIPDCVSGSTHPVTVPDSLVYRPTNSEITLLSQLYKTSENNSRTESTLVPSSVQSENHNLTVDVINSVTFGDNPLINADDCPLLDNENND